jgi:hypothetical protein
MPSAFGWLDTDTQHRRRMLDVVDLFKEQGTIDELASARSATRCPTACSRERRRAHPAAVRAVRALAAAAGSAQADAVGDAGGVPQPGDPDDHQLLAGGEKSGVIGNRARSARRLGLTRAGRCGWNRLCRKPRCGGLRVTVALCPR